MINTTPSCEGIAVAYKNWLLAMARQEADMGCKRLFSFKGSLPMYVADLTASWSSDERHNLMSARVKRHHFPSAYSPIMELTPPEERAYGQLEWPLESCWRVPGRPAVTYVSKISGAEFEIDAIKFSELLRMEGSLFGKYKIDRKRLRREIGAAMKTAFGEPERQAGGVWVYWTPIAGITVQTMVDFGTRRPTQFRYSQDIVALTPKGDANGRIQTVPGICDLVGSSQNDWTYVTEDDVPATAALLARLCEEAVDAVPEILENARAIDQAKLH